MNGRGGCYGKKLLAVAASASLQFFAQAAHADSLTILAKGTIASGCGVSQGSGFPTASLSAAGSVNATAIIDCNTGFIVKATSAKGAIKASVYASPGFTNVLPYTLTVTVPRDSGAPLSATCAAAALVSGQTGCALSPAGAGLSSGGITATAKIATLTAAWMLPAARLANGSYSDVITISVSAAP